MIEHEADTLAWKIVRRVRDRFVGLPREPTDADWADEIRAALSRADLGEDDYEQGYEDAIDEMESVCRNERVHLRQRQKAKTPTVATAAKIA